MDRIITESVARLLQCSLLHQGEELRPGLGVVPKHAQHRASHRLAVDLLHPTHHLRYLDIQIERHTYTEK